MDIVDRLKAAQGMPNVYWLGLSDDAVSEITTLRNQLAECQWISVEDRLPRNGELIICYDESGTFPATFYNGEFLRIEGEEEAWICTHWMPLPKPPKAMSEKG